MHSRLALSIAIASLASAGGAAIAEGITFNPYTQTESNYSRVDWSRGSYPTSIYGTYGHHAGWLGRMEAIHRGGGRRAISCVANPLADSCNTRLRTSDSYGMTPSVLWNDKYYGSLFAKSKMVSVQIFDAEITAMSGAEMKLVIRLKLDGSSTYGQLPSRSTLTFWVPSKEHNRNLGLQCEDETYKASGDNGFVYRGGLFWERHFKMNTNYRPHCDAPPFLAPAEAGDIILVPGESRRLDYVINKGDLPDPVEAVVLSNGYPAAYIWCELAKASCWWTYPSIWSKNTTNPRRRLNGHPARLEALYATHSGNYLNRINYHWAKAFYEAMTITAQPLDFHSRSERHNLTIAAQAINTLTNACSKVPQTLDSLPDENEQQLGDKAQRLTTFALQCLGKFFPGLTSINNRIGVNPTIFDERFRGNISGFRIPNTEGVVQPKHLCDFVGTTTQDNIRASLSRFGIPRYSCPTQ